MNNLPPQTCSICGHALEARPIQRERGGSIRIADNYCPDCHATRVPS